jgi:hypothetical protein
MPSDWLKQLMEDERRRDDVQVRAAAAAARKAEVVRVQGRRLIDELRSTVERDIGDFQDEFAGDETRKIIFDGTTDPQGGFVVRREAYPTVALNVVPQLQALSGAVGCRYSFTPSHGMPTREDRFDLTFAGDEVETLHVKHRGTGQVFATAGDLSEYLLRPVFTGRPR